MHAEAMMLHMLRCELRFSAALVFATPFAALHTLRCCHAADAMIIDAIRRLRSARYAACRYLRHAAILRRLLICRVVTLSLPMAGLHYACCRC